MTLTEKQLDELLRLKAESDRYIDEHGVPHPEATVFYHRAALAMVPELLAFARLGLKARDFLLENGIALSSGLGMYRVNALTEADVARRRGTEEKFEALLESARALEGSK